MTKLTKFSDQSPEAVVQDTSGVTVSGTPEHTVWVHFKGAGDAVRAGVWQSTAGVFRGPQNNQIEYCHILEGGATIRTQDGDEFEVSAGDGFVMDNGLQPVWTVKDYVKKQWVIVSVPAQD
ncbi:MAG: cupin domain-containing protein [Sedimentitalea sp.]